MVVDPEKLDVDGVGGARLESMMAKAAESRKSTSQGFSWKVKVKVNVTSALKAIPDCFSSSAVVSIVCWKS